MDSVSLMIDDSLNTKLSATPPSTYNQSTIAELPNPNPSPSKPLQYTKFSSQIEYEAFLTSISPPKEMCCPIFQDLLSDPVVAEDGNTYSREAITKWFATNPTKVSPVTNALMKNINLTPNLAIMSMVRRFKEEAGHELLVRCEVSEPPLPLLNLTHTNPLNFVSFGSASLRFASLRSAQNMERWTDDGQRALALIDAGADLTLRSTSPPPSPHYLDTAMMIILKKTNLPLVHKIVIESFNIQSLSLLVKSNTNQTCVEIVQHKLLTSNFDPITKKGWTVILAELAKREAKEKKDLAKQVRSHSVSARLLED